MSDNGEGQEGRVKWCPFLNEYCIKERCGVWAEMTRHVGGLQQKFGMCGFGAVVVILSEINMKSGGQQGGKVVLPGLYKG